VQSGFKFGDTLRKLDPFKLQRPQLSYQRVLVDVAELLQIGQFSHA
jgi:hypothetical protein